MGLEEILANIETDTKARVKSILDQSNMGSEKIIDGAKEDAAKLSKQWKDKADMDTKQLELRELSKANIEAKTIYQKAVNDSINAALMTIQENLDGWISSDDYSKLLNKLAKAAVEELGEGCTLMVQKGDLSKLKGLKNANIQESKEEFVGGLRGQSRDKSMYVDYSIEKILDGLRDSMAIKLLELIK